MSHWEPFGEDELLARAPGLRGCWDDLQPKLPSDRRWFAGTIDETALARLLHVPCPAFHQLSGGTGSLMTTVELLAGDAAPTGEGAEPAAWIRELARDFDPARADRLVLGTNSLEAGPFMLLDGNHRATARLLSRRGRSAEPDFRWPVVVALSGTPVAPW